METPSHPTSSCTSCRSPKATLNCGACKEPLCKKCAVFLDEATFSFLKKIPEDLSHTYYCTHCNLTLVEPALDSYNETMERAKLVYFFFKTQKKALPILKRAKDKVYVETCEDRNETVMRLAFQAAEQGFNSVIEAEVVSEKVRNAGYQKSRWSGVGFPAHLDSAKLERHSRQESAASFTN